MRTARIILAVLLGLLTALMLWTAVTVPMIAMAGPAIFALACGVVTWLVIPKRRKS